MILSFCTNCGSQRDSSGTPCQSCQAPSSDLADKTLFATVAKQKKLQSKAFQRKNQLEKLKIAIKSRQEHVAKNKRVYFPVFAGSSLILIYLGVSLVIFGATGPEQKINEYLFAVKTGNFKALEDATLFPESNGKLPDWISESIDLNAVKDLALTSFDRNGMEASAKFSSPSFSDEHLVRLSASFEFSFGFPVPVWKVETKAPEARVVIDSRLHEAQTVNLGRASFQVSALRETIDDSFFSTLPGVYKTKVESYGFIAGSEESKFIFSTPTNSLTQLDLSINAGATSLPAAIRSNANKKALSIANTCAKTKCKALPKFKVRDFNLWSQYDRGTYTSSSFDYKFAKANCSLDEIKADRFNSATANYSCTVSAKGHLYVRYTYYYGYYSDYWWYWNFYDTRTETFQVELALSSNSEGESFKVLGGRAK